MMAGWPYVATIVWTGMVELLLDEAVTADFITETMTHVRQSAWTCCFGLCGEPILADACLAGGM